MKPTLFANGLIINEGFRFIGSVVIDGLMFSRVDYGRIDLREVDREVYDVVDCEGKMVIPGVIDEHVHFRDPGMTEKGDLATESRAAIAGGVTSFFDMPNTRPATTTIEAWEEKMQRAAAVSAANYAFFMGVANNNIDQLLAADPTRVPGAKLFLGSSAGNMLATPNASRSSPPTVRPSRPAIPRGSPWDFTAPCAHAKPASPPPGTPSNWRAAPTPGST